MRTAELCTIIDDMHEVLRAAGSDDAAASLSELANALRAIKVDDADAAIDGVRGILEHLTLPPAMRYATRLAEVEFNEAAFLSVWREINHDRELKKPDLQAILRAYQGKFDRKATLTRLKDDLKRAFYTKLYDRDAQQMANRATPL